MRRNHEDARIALDCLALAQGAPGVMAHEIVELAGRYYAFATGDDAADKLAAVRAAVTP